MNNLTTPVGILSAKRLPIGKINGLYTEQSPETLVANLLQQQVAMLSTHRLKQVDQVILGNVTNQGGNIARRAALAAGIGSSTPAYTIDAQCASGLVAIASGAQAILNQDAKLVVAGGVESTSRSYVTIDRETNEPLKRFPMVPEGQLDLDMGIVAENMSSRYNISREQQDNYACNSHQKAKKAFENKQINAEIVPFSQASVNITQDQCPRFDTSLSKLHQLKPAFRSGGTVTAGNSCPINDGAATVLMTGSQTGEAMAGYYLGHTTVGIAPEKFILGPIAATQKLLDKYALTMSDIAVVELNEAFAVQSILCQAALKITDEQLNPLGGALAYGHPYGATGGIMIARLLNSLNRITQPALGIATLCVAGGMGMSMLIGNQHWQV